jgi:hypothetical protein
MVFSSRSLRTADVHGIIQGARSKRKAMSKNTGQSGRIGAVKERVQAKNPITNRYVKIDTTTGRIVDQKKTPGPYKGIKDLTRKK